MYIHFYNLNLTSEKNISEFKVDLEQVYLYISRSFEEIENLIMFLLLFFQKTLKNQSQGNIC
jgi:hypothetical protein